MKKPNHPSTTYGSQHDLQVVANLAPHLLEEALCVKHIEFLSPLASEGYGEYQDDFLKKLKIDDSAHPLKDFWPAKGPQWDGLAKTDKGEILLIEAKAHISETFGDGTQAKGESLEQIRKALLNVAMSKNVNANFIEDIWLGPLYQTANRIAFLDYLVNKLGVKAKLVYVIFLNDPIAHPSETKDRWNAVLDTAERYMLRLPGRFQLAKHIKRAFIDYKKLPLIKI